MRLILCDDDAHLRAVVRSVVQDRGHEVVGEAETTVEAYELLATHRPDAVIVDIALRAGSGQEVARAASGQGCCVIVFSAYLDSVDMGSLADAMVAKPDFGALEAALDAMSSRAVGADKWRQGLPDRRATTVTDRAAPQSPIDEAEVFYRALGEARGGDTIMIIDVLAEEPTVGDSLMTTLRGIVRAEDHLMRRDSQIVLLLVSGHSETAMTVAARLKQVSDATPYGSQWTWRHAVVSADDLPSDVYQRVRESPLAE